jgi:hypothetical protein
MNKHRAASGIRAASAASQSSTSEEIGKIALGTLRKRGQKRYTTYISDVLYVG